MLDILPKVFFLKLFSSTKKSNVAEVIRVPWASSLTFSATWGSWAFNFAANSGFLLNTSNEERVFSIISIIFVSVTPAPQKIVSNPKKSL